MLGIVIFVLILLFYGIVLSKNVFLTLFPIKEGETAEGFTKYVNEFYHFFDNKSLTAFLSICALVIGLWNFFAPDFGGGNPVPILGALIPSLAMLLNGLVLYPEIVEVLSIPQEKKEQYYKIVAQVSGLMGVITLIIAVLHIILFKQILF